jgi:membrane-associated protease RseP (regulator of RpoE activity)
VDTFIASYDGEAEEWEVKRLKALGLIPTINGVPAKIGDKFKAGDVLGTVPVYHLNKVTTPIPAPRPAKATFTVSQYSLDQYSP